MRILFALLMLATPLFAQERVISAVGGLDDKFKEIMILEINVNDAELLDVLIVTRDGYEWDSPTEMVRFEGVFHLDPDNSPELSLLNLNTFQIDYLGCNACGRYNTQQSLTIGEVDGIWQAINYKTETVDRVEPWRVSICEVDLIAGFAHITLSDHPTQRLETIYSPVPLIELDPEYSPEICSLTALSDEEWELYKPADWEE